MPSWRASSAVMAPPVNSSSLALRGPISQVWAWSSTPLMPMNRTGSENSALSAAMIRSHGQQSMSPAAMHLPCTAAMVGFGMLAPRLRVLEVVPGLPVVVALGAGELVLEVDASSRSPDMSWPAEKCLPLDWNTMTLTSLSASAARQARSSSASTLGLWALAASGRSRVMTPTVVVGFVLHVVELHGAYIFPVRNWAMPVAAGNDPVMPGAEVAGVGDDRDAGDRRGGVAAQEDERVGLLQRGGRLDAGLLAVVGAEPEPRLLVVLGERACRSGPGQMALMRMPRLSSGSASRAT